MNVQWIDTPDALEAFVDSIGDLVAVDTESDHFHAYNARICLIQAATRDSAALIDPLALDHEAMQPFLNMLADPAVTKVFHAGRNDMGEFDRDYGVSVENIFDTQIACRFLNKGGSGLSWLLEDFFGVRTSKKYQRYDWTRRPIPEEPAEYAATDVLYLLEARDRLIEELDAAGWLEPFRQQCTYVARATEHSDNPFDPEGWRRLRTKRDPNGLTRATLAALWQWRHELCESLNQAALHVLQDGALVRLATRRPNRPEKIHEIRGISKVILDHHVDELLRVIDEARHADHPPERLPRRTDYERPSELEQRRLKSLKKWRNKTAKELGIPTEFIGTNATFEKIAASPPSTIDELLEFDEILPWQVERFGDVILSRLESAG
jgi:ribonuclease D